jgi:tRNA pseudouridine32 synthase/23S rRNA pseudouridine746 synthase
MDFQPEVLTLWCDDCLLVINKPAGLLSLPDGYDPTAPHLRAILEPHFGRLWIVHRLDRWTSGVMLMGRTAVAHRQLNAQFQERKTIKCYHALVAGNPPWESISIQLPLRADADRRHRTVIDEHHGKPALTEVRTLTRYPDYTLLEAIPRTGRPHQIRAHLAHIGFPLLADPLYGNRQHPAHQLLPRLGLHAKALALQHPLSGKPLCFEAPTPHDFLVLLNNGPDGQ